MDFAYGHDGVGPFKTSQQAYDTLYIGDAAQAAKLQAESRRAKSDAESVKAVEAAETETVND